MDPRFADVEQWGSKKRFHPSAEVPVGWYSDRPTFFLRFEGSLKKTRISDMECAGFEMQGTRDVQIEHGRVRGPCPDFFVFFTFFMDPRSAGVHQWGSAKLFPPSTKVPARW